jgi:hypothetical protein
LLDLGDHSAVKVVGVVDDDVVLREVIVLALSVKDGCFFL